MTHVEALEIVVRLLVDVLKACTIALRIALGHIESQYIHAARAMAQDVVTDERFRMLNGEQRAAIADAATAIEETVAVVKGLKKR